LVPPADGIADTNKTSVQESSMAAGRGHDRRRRRGVKVISKQTTAGLAVTVKTREADGSDARLTVASAVGRGGMDGVVMKSASVIERIPSVSNIALVKAVADKIQTLRTHSSYSNKPYDCVRTSSSALAVR